MTDPNQSIIDMIFGAVQGMAPGRVIGGANLPDINLTEAQRRASQYSGPSSMGLADELGIPGVTDEEIAELYKLELEVQRKRLQDELMGGAGSGDAGVAESARQFDIQRQQWEREFAEQNRQWNVQQLFEQMSAADAQAVAQQQLLQDRARNKQSASKNAMDAFLQLVGHANIPGLENWNPYTEGEPMPVQTMEVPLSRIFMDETPEPNLPSIPSNWMRR